MTPQFKGPTLAILLLASAAVAVLPGRAAFAWKPLTHATEASAAAEALPADDPMRQVLLQNRRYLALGAVGPDIFYFTAPSRSLLLSDIAHYCETGKLAQQIREGAGGDPQLQAFAHGWLSHIVADSVAHPWVNGFVGSAFQGSVLQEVLPALPVPGLPTALLLPDNAHGLLEGWVNAEFTKDSSKAEFLASMRLLATDERIADLLGQAYEATYGQVFAGAQCSDDVVFDPKAGPIAIVRKLDVKKAAKLAGERISFIYGVGAFAEPWRLLAFGTEQVPTIGRTAPEYLALTRAFIEKGWRSPAPLETTSLNLDLGIDSSSQALEDLLDDVNLPRPRVFDTPGTRFRPRGIKPPFQDRCKQLQSSGDACLTRPPGGDSPDDNESAASPGALAEVPALRDVERALWRTALRRGESWPALAARQQALSKAVAAAIDGGDLQGAASLQEGFDRWLRESASSSVVFLQAYASFGRPNTTSLYEHSSVGVLQKGFASGSRLTIERFEEPVRTVGVDLMDSARSLPVLVIPSGGLYGLSQSDQFRLSLESYVSSGGAAIVFAQQRGSDFSVLPTPDGRPIGAWGWYEDNSCYFKGAYIESFHPVLASQKEALVTSAIDGFFDGIPEESIVLLRRVKNDQPAMFMYPYGQGWVIVSSSYDDWGGFNQSSAGGRAIIRDAIAWAKKRAELPIHQPGSAVSIDLQVKNVTDLPASQVKLVLMSPSRDRVVAEQTVSRSLAPGGTGEVAFSHAFAADAELGIYHVDYELLDDAGVVVQPATEEDTGRIVVAKPPTLGQHRPADLTLTILAPGGEDIVFDDPFHVRYRFVNRKDTPRRLRLYWGMGWHTPAFREEVVVAANSTLELEGSFANPLRFGAQRLFLHVFEEGGERKLLPWWIQATQAAEPFVYQFTEAKGFRAHLPAAELSVTTDRPIYAPGQTAHFAVSVENRLPIGWDGLVRFTKPIDGTLLAEQSVVLGPDGSASVDIPLASDRLLPLAVSVVRGSRVVVEQRAFLRVALADLRSRGVVQGPWSRSSVNSVTWSLENVGTVPLLGGSVRAVLASLQGDTLWEATQPLVLGEAPNGQGSVTFTVPPLPADLRSGVFTMTADNGAGGEVVVRSSITSRLVASARTLAASYRSGEAGEVEVTVTNSGTSREEGSVAGSIEGIAALAEAAFALPPGQQTVLRLPFVVPGAALGGLYRGRALLPDGQTAEFTVRVPFPGLVLSVEDRVYAAGDRVAVRARNEGGSATTSEIHAELSGVAQATETVTVEPGAETVVLLPPLDAQLPTGRYVLNVSAVDVRYGLTGRLAGQVAVSGTEASVTVATDREVYGTGSLIQASAMVTNGSLPLEGAGLHLEMSTTCAPGGEGETYLFETWDGAQWTPRASRGRGPMFETDQVDLSPYWPDADGEQKVRIRHEGAGPAHLDYVALVSGGVLVAPTAAALDGGGDVLGPLLVSDNQGPEVAGQAIVVTFPAAASPSLVYRAREGDQTCFPYVLWQRDVPVDLAGGAVREVEEAVAATSSGQYVLSGVLRSRDGHVLSEATASFEVVSGGLAVSLSTETDLYRTGTSVTATGTLRNLGMAEEPSASFSISLQGGFCDAQVHFEPIALAPGEARPYSLSFVPADFCPGETELGLVARLSSPTSFAQSEWSFRTGAPALDVRFEVPDPVVRLTRSNVGLVAAEESDLDAVTKTEAGALEGSFPFPVVLDGVRYRAFWQSVDGFVELIPEDVPFPTGVGGACLENTGVATTLVAAFLTDLDASASGFVGYKRYPAGSSDRAGRVFATDTLVFFWDAPATSDTQRNRFQLLVGADGSMRIDQGEIFAPLLPPSLCRQVGLGLPGGRIVAFEGQEPSSLRVESGVGRAPFQGKVVVRNDGAYPGALSLDYGRAGGARTLDSLTVPPGETRSLSFQDQIAQPTTYTLVTTGDAALSLERVVSPSEGVAVGYRGPTDLPPGPAMLPVEVTKTGGVAGPVEVTFVLTGPSGSQTLTRTYDLEPGIPTGDLVAVDLALGASSLSVGASVPVSGGPFGLRAAPPERVILTVHAGPVTDGALPITADIVNSGLASFAGQLQVEGSDVSSTPVSVAAGATVRVGVGASLAAASPGPASFVVRLVSEAGVVVGEASLSHEVVGPQVVVVESPQGQSFDPAAPASLRFLLRNTGDQTAAGQLRFQVSDADQGADFSLDPGQETEVVFQIRVDDDVEQKVHRGLYALEVGGALADTGQVEFTVNGIALAVEALLDKDAYLAGDIARLTLRVTNDRPSLGTGYLARVQYGAFDQTQPLTVAGTATLVFDIPLPEVTGEAAFVGITHPDGRSLYINTLHVRGALSSATVTLDRQVYAPGESVLVTATAGLPGTLSLEAPGYAETVELAGSVSRTFALPADLPGGTYFLTWSLAGGASGASGSTPFDVAGLRVRVFSARLDSGRYRTGDTIRTSLQIHSSQAAAVTLRVFVLDPEGASQPGGEATVGLQGESDVLTTHAWPFQSAVAGLHRLVYGLYQPGGDQLLASGSLAFDVGNAVALGVRTGRSEYPVDAAVDATVSVFASGPAVLRLEVDGEQVATPEVTGSGMVETAATLTGIGPGPHQLVAVLEGGGYTSRAATTFSVGSSLPDLVPGLANARPVSGASWRAEVTVGNIGRSAAPPTQVVVRDLATMAVLGTTEAPALAAGGSAQLSVAWNVQGQTGDHQIEVLADASSAVREFREDNNRAVSLLQVPSLLIGAVAGSAYEANVEADLGASVTNLTSDTSFGGLTVQASVTRPDGTLIPLPAASLPSLDPGASTGVGTPWLVGRSTPGRYVLQSRLLDGGGATRGSASVAFEVLPTIAFGGTVTASPNPAASGQPVALGGRVENRGNVAASGTARFEIVAPDQTIAASTATPAQVALEGATDVTASIDPLDVQPGGYDLLLGVEVLDRLYPVARAPLVVTGETVEATLGADLTPRVLAFVGGSPLDPTEAARRTAFVQEALAGTGAILRTTSSAVEFARLFRSGLWNTHLLMGDSPLLVPVLGDELREAVFRGDGLVYVLPKAAGSVGTIEPALGVKVEGRIPGVQHTLEVLAGPLGPPQTLVIAAEATRLKLAGAVVAGRIGAAPVLAVNTFGQGRAVTMAFDPVASAQDPARAALLALCARGVLFAAPSQAGATAAGTVVPLALRLENRSSAMQAVDVTVELPAGLRVAAADDAPLSADPLAWRLDLAGGGERALRFQVVLPDQAGTFSIASVVKVNGQVVPVPPQLTLVVEQTTEEALNGVTSDLQSITVSPGDRGHLQSALALLQAAHALPNHLLGLEGRIRLTAEAASKLGRVESADLHGPRAELARLIAAWERASYDLAAGASSN